MTVQAKTYTVALDGNNQPQPLTLAGAAVGFVTTRWVVISNLTPYVMELSGTDDQPEGSAALAPGTANKFAWTNQYGALVAHWVNPITGAPPSTPQVIVEYSDDPTGGELVGAYPSTIQSGTFIGSITGPVNVTGNVNANITNANIAVTGSVSVTSVGGTVTVGGSVNANVTNTVNVTVPGTVNVQGVAGGTTIGIAGTVSVSSGTVNIGTVAGTVAVSGNVTATISGTPTVTISGTVTATISSGTVAISGNVTVQKIVNVVSGQGNIDVLIAPGTAYSTVTTTFSFTAVASALHTYDAIIVVITPTAGGRPLCVQMADGTTGPSYVSGFGPINNNAGTACYQAMTAMSNDIGDSVKGIFFGFAASGSGTYAVYGVSPAPPFGIRPDGRSFPVGAITTQVVTANGAGATLVGAPTSPQRILLKRLLVASLTSAVEVDGTIGGTTTPLALSFASPATVNLDIPPEGILLDGASPLTVVARAGSTQQAVAVYDIVV
jgi:hypothetical protein